MYGTNSMAPPTTDDVNLLDKNYLGENKRVASVI